MRKRSSKRKPSRLPKGPALVAVGAVIAIGVPSCGAKPKPKPPQVQHAPQPPQVHVAPQTEPDPPPQVAPDPDAPQIPPERPKPPQVDGADRQFIVPFLIGPFDRNR